MPPSQKTNLYAGVPGYYIYLQSNRRYAAYKRYADTPSADNWNRKYFNKAGLFYTLEEARVWLESLPDKMERPRRNATSEHTITN
jgi:hypothetical protein